MFLMIPYKNIWIIKYQEKMNLRERMQHQNKNNSEILNNSNFDFNRANHEDQMYEKSRREC